jgi:hypothetical protein
MSGHGPGPECRIIKEDCMKKLPLLCMLLVGCSLMQSGGLPRQPELIFVDAVPHSFTLTGCRVDIRLQAKNPNSFNINLDRLDVHLYINDHKTASSAFDGVSLKAKGTSPLNTTVSVSYIGAGMAVIGALRDKSGVRYAIKGVAHCNTPLGVMRFPVTLYKNR